MWHLQIKQNLWHASDLAERLSASSSVLAVRQGYIFAKVRFVDWQHLYHLGAC